MTDSAPDWTPVVDLVEKLNALAMEWDKTPDRQVCAGDLRAVLSGQYDPRAVQPVATRPKASSCPECKAMAGTRHLDGCSGQYREDYVGGDV